MESTITYCFLSMLLNYRIYKSSDTRHDKNTTERKKAKFKNKGSQRLLCTMMWMVSQTEESV